MEKYNAVQWALSGDYDDEMPVLIDAERPSRYLSKRRVSNLITRLTGSFPSESTVCVHAGNDILYPVLVLAILASGCVWTGTNPTCNADELCQHLLAAEAGTVVAAPEHIKIVKDAVARSQRPIAIISFTDILDESPSNGVIKAQRVKTLHDLLQESNCATLQSGLHGISIDSTAILMATSGTTGTPKMAERSHRSIISETKAIADDDSLKPYKVRRLYCTPVYHAFSFPDMVINALRLGHPSYFMSRFGYNFAIKVQEFGITETLAVPSMVLALVKQASAEGERQKLCSLKTVLCAGAPLPLQLAKQLRDLVSPSLRVVQAWGMTECGRIATFKYPDTDETGSVGKPIGDCRVKQDESNTFILESGRRAAELLICGSQLMGQYRHVISGTAPTIDSEGWMRTGDIGYFDNERLYLVDRAKDLIKVDGWSVSPAELETAITGLDSVEDAAVISYGYSTDEHPVVFVVAKADGLSVAGLKRHLLSRLSRYKVAKCEIRLIDHIPRGPSSKVLRHILRARLTST